MVSIAGATRSCPFGFKADVPVPIVWRPRCFSHRLVDDGPQRRQGADRIRIGGIAGQRKRLAAASSEIDRLPRTRPTGFLHPLVATEGEERSGLLPDPAERVIADPVEA